MVDLRKRVIDSDNMCIDNNGRSGFPSAKFLLREERKRILRISKAKYLNIEDHETGMRRFTLIRNTLQRLQLEAREDKLARHSAKENNVSPSYLSASKNRSPSPPCDMEVDDVLRHYSHPGPSPIIALSDDEDEQPPCKRPRLSLDEDKENHIQNSCEDRLVDVVREKCKSDDSHEILREVYESYTGENLSNSRLLSPFENKQSFTSHSLQYSSTNNLYSNTLSPIDYNTPTDLSYRRSSNKNSSNFNDSECNDWWRPQQHYPCSQSAFLGNDLKSVVYQSLITSL